jgi:glycerophosphoryl diester phosphodiesterase
MTVKLLINNQPLTIKTMDYVPGTSKQHRSMNKIVSAAILGTLLMTGCRNSQPVSQQNPALPKFDAQGHRGSRGLMPENTIPAMRHALVLGVTTLEMDCHITRDKQVVVTHDPHINHLYARTPAGADFPKEEGAQYTVYNMDYAQVRAFDIGSKFYSLFPKQQQVKSYIPLLSELIDSVQTYIRVNKRPQVFYNIETKSKAGGDHQLHPDPENFVKLLMTVIEQKKITPYVTIQSFDLRTLQVLHQKYSHVRTAYLVSDKKTVAEHLQVLGFTPAILSPAFKLVTAEMVKQCHERQIKVIPWTANTPEDIAWLKSLGVDGIISDYPDLL